MPELQRLRLDHAPALLAFKRANRAYCAASIPDRGDEYFERFDERHESLLAEQSAGLHHFHVLVGDGGEATLDNAGSRAVLARSGFVVTGEVVLDGRPELSHERKLVTV